MDISRFAPSRLLHNLPTQLLGVAVWFIVFFSSIFCVGFLYTQSSKYYQDAIREHIGDLSIIAAKLVDLEAHEQLLSEEQINSSLYREALAPLVNLHLSLPKINYVYTMRSIEGIEYFVLDTSTDQAIVNQQTSIGRPPIPSLLLEQYEQMNTDEADTAMLAGQTYVYEVPFEDSFGAFISGQTPLFDADGNYLGYLGIDYDLTEFNNRLALLRTAGLWTVLIAMILSTFLARLAIHLRQQSIDTIHQLEAAEHTVRLEKEKAEKANKAKSDILAIASHDLKNPLTAISGLSEIALEITQESDNPDTEIIKFLKNINTASTHMSKLISGILANEGMEQQGLILQIETLNLSTLTHDTLEFNQKNADKKQIQINLKIDKEVVIEGDATRLREAFDNYISNAIKYSQPGQNITITLKTLSTNSSNGSTCIEFRVSDEGPGLSEEDQSKLFNKFQRLSAQPTGGESSTGLGLSIVKTITELHLGSVGCDSKPGQGASFWLILPIQQKP